MWTAAVHLGGGLGVVLSFARRKTSRAPKTSDARRRPRPAVRTQRLPQWWARERPEPPRVPHLSVPFGPHIAMCTSIQYCGAPNPRMMNAVAGAQRKLQTGISDEHQAACSSCRAHRRIGCSVHDWRRSSHLVRAESTPSQRKHTRENSHEHQEDCRSRRTDRRPSRRVDGRGRISHLVVISTTSHVEAARGELASRLLSTRRGTGLREPASVTRLTDACHQREQERGGERPHGQHGYMKPRRCEGFMKLVHRPRKGWCACGSRERQ